MKAIDQLMHEKALIKLEREEDLRIYKAQVLDRSLKERVEKGTSIYPLACKKSFIGTGEQVVLHLERSQAGKTPALQVGDSIAVFGMMSGQEVGRNSGILSRIRNQEVRVVLGIDYVPDWIFHAQLGIDKEFDDRTYREMEQAVNRVMEAKANDRLGELRETLLGSRNAGFHEWEVGYKNPVLNPSQNQAIETILAARDVAMVHGPPGTGKTTTLIQAIKETLNHEHQVMVCAASNNAVDLLTLRCIEEGIHVVRIGNPARVEETLQNYTLDGAIAGHEDYKELKKIRKEAEATRAQALKYKRNFGAEERKARGDMLREARELKKMARQLEEYIIHHILQQSQVITCTLVGAAHTILGGKKFHTLFIDEAAQALGPACWIPILRANRVIFAGDHHQLPPTVKSTEAMKGGLGKTLFEHIMEHKGEHVSVLLEYQYRMHEHIMAFSGEWFYEGKLKADISVRGRKLGEGFDAMEFVDTAGCGFDEVKNPETLSTSNPEEAQLLLRHLALLINKIQDNIPEILEASFSLGIISPYKEQVNVLKAQVLASPMLSEYRPYFSINTVDGFQGQERDVVYISLVRSNEKNDIGFLRDIRRMNVALTRARKKLVVIGDSATLAGHSFYEAFMAYTEKIGAYKSAWEYMGED